MYASNKENMAPATNPSQDAFRSSIPRKKSKRSATLDDSSSAAGCVDRSLEARLQKALKENEQLKEENEKLKEEKEEKRAQVQSWVAIVNSKKKEIQEKDLLLSKKESEIDGSAAVEDLEKQVEFLKNHVKELLKISKNQQEWNGGFLVQWNEKIKEQKVLELQAEALQQQKEALQQQVENLKELLDKHMHEHLKKL